MFGWFSRRKSLPSESPPEVPEEPPRREITAKVNSLENVKYRSRKGSFKLPKESLPYRLDVPSKVGSLTNLNHKPRESKVKIFSEKLDFRSHAHSKIAETFRSSQTSTPVSDKRGSIVEMLINSIKSSVGVQSPSVQKEHGGTIPKEPAKSSVDKRRRKTESGATKNQSKNDGEQTRNESEGKPAPKDSEVQKETDRDDNASPAKVASEDNEVMRAESAATDVKETNQSDPYESLNDTSEDELRGTADSPIPTPLQSQQKSTDRGPWRI